MKVLPLVPVKGASAAAKSSKVTIPEQWVNNVKQLGNTNTMSWIVQFYAYDSTTNNLYARSDSDAKSIDGWSN